MRLKLLRYETWQQRDERLDMNFAVTEYKLNTTGLYTAASEWFDVGIRSLEMKHFQQNRTDKLIYIYIYTIIYTCNTKISLQVCSDRIWTAGLQNAMK